MAHLQIVLECKPTTINKRQVALEDDGNVGYEAFILWWVIGSEGDGHTTLVRLIEEWRSRRGKKMSSTRFQNELDYVGYMRYTNRGTYLAMSRQRHDRLVMS